jgi:hypothetical protein
MVSELSPEFLYDKTHFVKGENIGNEKTDGTSHDDAGFHIGAERMRRQQK